MKLGPFVFSINTAAYQTLQRQDSYRWQSVDVIGSELAHQYTGPGERTLSLQGVVYTHYDAGRQPFSSDVVGTGQIDSLRGVADSGAPMILTDGRGRAYGRWIVTSLSNKESIFFDNGAPKKQEFDLSLTFYGNRRGGFGGFGLNPSSFLGGIFKGGAIAQVFSSATALADVSVGIDINPSDLVTEGMEAAGIDLNLGAAAGLGARATDAIDDVLDVNLDKVGALGSQVSGSINDAVGAGQAALSNVLGT